MYRSGEDRSFLCSLVWRFIIGLLLDSALEIHQSENSIFLWNQAYGGVMLCYRVFSHDVTAAMLVSQNKELAAMLLSQLNLWELNSIFMQILSFVSVNQYGR